MKPKFSRKELKQLVNRLEIPESYSLILERSEHVNFKQYAKKLLREFDIVLTPSDLKLAGSIYYASTRAGKKDSLIIEGLVDEIMKEKILRNITIKNSIKYSRKLKEKYIVESNFIKRLVESNGKMETLVNSHGVKLSDEAHQWYGKVRLIGTKSFKTVWYKKIKDKNELIDVDEVERVNRKFYFNKSFFSVPVETFDFIKSNYEKFEPGFNEFLEYLFDKIEEVKGNGNGKSGNEYVADRIVYVITTAKKISDISENENVLAINTNGMDRPVFKGYPLLLNKEDVKSVKEYFKNYPTIPIAAQQQGGGMGGLM